MEGIILLLIGLGMGYWLGRKVGRRGMEEEKVGLIEKQATEKKRNKEAILGLMEEVQPQMTNQHLEMYLGISDATATRYMDELEKEGKVRQVGKSGPGVYYERI